MASGLTTVSQTGKRNSEPPRLKRGHRSQGRTSRFPVNPAPVDRYVYERGTQPLARCRQSARHQARRTAPPGRGQGKAIVPSSQRSGCAFRGNPNARTRTGGGRVTP